MWTIESSVLSLVQTLALAVVVICWTIVAAPARAQPAAADPATAQFEALRTVMLDWTRGLAPTQQEVAAVFVVDNDPRPGRETACIARVEEDLTEYLGERDSAMLLPLAFWQVRMLFGALEWSNSDYVREVDIDRVYDRLKKYRAKRADDPSMTQEQVDRRALLAWTGVGEIFSRSGKTGFYKRAEEALLLGLEVDRDSEPARYLAAWVGEKLHQPLDLMRAWRGLAQDHPRKVEYRLRFGMVAKRAARTETALEALEFVARSDGEEWMRILAYVEWVQTLLGGGDEERRLARDILAEARRELPGRPGLDLLASHQLLVEDRRQALRLAERIEAHDWDGQELSPRLRYEIPHESVVGPPRQELIELLQESWRRMAAKLEALDADDVLSRKSRSACDRRR